MQRTQVDYDPNSQLSVMIKFVHTLLKEDSPLCTEAAVTVYRKFYDTLIPSTETFSSELFTAKLESIRKMPNDTYITFLLVIIFLQHRQLLDNSQQLVVIAASSLSTKPIDFKNLDSFIYELSYSSFILNSSFELVNDAVQNLLVFLCEYFLGVDILGIDQDYLDSWIQLFVFVGRWPMINQLVDKICFQPSLQSEKKVKSWLRNLNNIISGLRVGKMQKDAQAKRILVREEMKRRYHIFLKRDRHEIRQSISYLMGLVSRLYSSFHLFAGSSPSAEDLVKLRRTAVSKLRIVINIITLHSHENPLKRKSAPKEEAEEELLNWCNIIALCNKVESKSDGFKVISHLVYNVAKRFWLRPELLSAVAGFIAFAGWEEFVRCYDDLKYRLTFRVQSKSIVLGFFIGLTNELLQKNQRNCDEAAIKVFESFCSTINFSCLKDAKSKKNFRASVFQCLSSSVEEEQLILFFHVVLLMESFIDLEVCDFGDTVEAGIACLKESATADLHHFVQILFGKIPSRLIAMPFKELKPSCQITVKTMCNKFIDQIGNDPDSFHTEDLLNWMRLIVYTEKVHLAALMCNLCFSRGNASLRNLLATEEFLTNPEFKILREHSILTAWKRRQEKESFVKLFTPRNKSKKRKLKEEDSTDTRTAKRRRFDDLNGAAEQSG